MPSRARRVWVTRTEPGASETAERIRALGHTPVVAPLLVTQELDVDPPRKGEALAFTSPNGVRHYHGPTTATAWCVGEATADAARAKGFTDVRVGGEDVADLAARLTYELDRPLLHWAGAHVAGDLVGALQSVGLTARRAIAYRAEAVANDPLDADVDAVLFHSPRAARIYSDLASNRASVAVSLSPRVARAVEPDTVYARYTADAPTEAALMATLARVLEG